MMAELLTESEIQSEASEQQFDVASDIVSDVKKAIKSEDVDTILQQIDELHAADKAELINTLPSEHRCELANMLAGDGFDHEILPYLSSEAADDVLEALGIEGSADALIQLDTDDAIDVIEELGAQEQQDLLDAVPELLREELTEGLSYPQDSAGRLMTKKLISVPDYWTVGQTIDHIRDKADVPELFYVVYTTDPKFRPVGRVQLSAIMHEPRGTLMSDIMVSDTYAVKLDTDQEDVAYLFRKYGLVEAPVVNESGRLVGTITVDDVVHVIQEEEEEDYLAAGGVKSQDIGAGLSDTFKQRFPWLFINLLTAILASAVIGVYEDVIEQLVVLAILMPIVASMGGNAGTQSVTVAVRALATKQLKSSNAFAAIRKELFIGLLNGVGIAAIMAGGVYIFYNDLMLAGVFAAATVLTLMVAGFSGAAIPLLLNKMNVDPAVSSGVFLTTVTDVVGFFVFLGMAGWILL